MDSLWFDNYEEDGQLSLFHYEGEDNSAAVQVQDADSDFEEKLEAETQTNLKLTSKAMTGAISYYDTFTGDGSGIRRCTCCARLLLPKEKDNGYEAYCNRCEITFAVTIQSPANFQK